MDCQEEDVIPTIARHVYENLGPGHAECTYHNAMAVALRLRAIPYESEKIVPVSYEGHTVGHRRADIIVDRRLVLEFKAVAKINDAAVTQARSYLELLDLERAYIINFAGEECQVRLVTRPTTHTASPLETVP